MQLKTYEHQVSLPLNIIYSLSISLDKISMDKDSAVTGLPFILLFLSDRTEPLPPVPTSGLLEVVNSLSFFLSLTFPPRRSLQHPYYSLWFSSLKKLFSHQLSQYDVFHSVPDFSGDLNQYPGNQ